ncbi:aminotransferase class IV [Streptomyces sp. NPDC007088]|uniref:aminotransferase class IV n=1 Tax=Streptomyces sp. NPDC007088 TaxID=3364773 RepID=UPI0036ABD9E7
MTGRDTPGPAPSPGSAPGPLQRSLGILRMEVDGRPPTADDLLWRAVVNDGHFTAMQIRGGRVRGLRAHLDRLAEGSRELWGLEPDGDLVRARVRHALGGDLLDAAVRIYVHRPLEALSLFVTVREPVEAGRSAKRLRSVAYVRPLAHVKHLGGFGQIHAGRVAAGEGFDEALLTGPEGLVSEGAVTNVLFHDGERFVAPDGPSLEGTTLRLLAAGLAAAGSPVAREPVRLAELGRFRAAFVCNSQGVAPVQAVDEREFAVDDRLYGRLEEVYGAVPWDVV